MCKCEKINDEILYKYNNSYHEGIKYTPTEGWDNPNKIIAHNQDVCAYREKFYKRYERNELKEGTKILYSRNDNVKNKDMKGRFYNKGFILRGLKPNSYLIRTTEGKIIKRNGFQVKEDLG